MGTRQRAVEVCLHEMLHCSVLTATGGDTAPHAQPVPGRTLLHRLAAALQQLDAAAAEREDCSSTSQLTPVVDLCMALWGKLDSTWLEEAGQ